MVYNEFMVKKGDTLIEVTLAVGIFSMIAVAVVAIMSNGTSETQTALETTLAREAIDTQAEALRFIHDSAAIQNQENDESSMFIPLWDKIKEQALSADGQTDVYQFSPSRCADLYSNKDGGTSIIQHQKAFFIDLEQLGVAANLKQPSDTEAVVSSTPHGDRFKETKTFPHITEGNALDPSEAEGIYVIGVKGSKSNDGTELSLSGRDYYDFYIRTCWYGSNADLPSTISTVIRLLDI